LEFGKMFHYICKSELFRNQNEYMKLKQSVIALLDCNKGYGLIMMSLDCSFSTAREYVKNNRDELTKAAMLIAIRKEFNLTDDQILETEERVEKA